MSKIPLIIIAGPTASGKTGLSVEIAKRRNGEIVSADSVQIYKYLDIGSAKVTEKEKCGVPHYLIDTVMPDAEFSVADYTKLAHEHILDIHSRGKLPVMVGGTGLYINSVVNDIDFTDADTDYQLRSELESLAKEHGAEHLLKMLAEFDNVSAQRLHANNLRRIIRAIEFYRTTGVPISVHQEETRKKESRYAPVMLAVEWDREQLYERIDMRVDMMFSLGLIDEVVRLVDMGYTKALNSMKGIGYKEVIDYLRGYSTYYEMLEIIKRGSRRYAKRQLTWFRRDERIHWLRHDEEPITKALEIIDTKMSRLK